MSATYSPSQIADYENDYISSVRWLIGDTDTNDADVSDEEINALYSTTTTNDNYKVRVLRTAKSVADYMLTQYAKQSDFSSAGTSVTSPYEHWKDVSAKLNYLILRESNAPLLMYGERTSYYTEQSIMKQYPTAQQLKMMRRAVKRYMPDTILIYSVSTSYTSEGGYTPVRTLVTTVKGKIHEVSGSERMLLAPLVNDGQENIETAKLDLPYGTVINANNEVETADGKIWNVHSTNNSQTFTAETEALLYRKIVNDVVQ